jgi:hypothetical protein
MVLSMKHIPAAFRIHGVSPEFIEKLQSLGYKHPDPDELVAMRIHNVTPESLAIYAPEECKT